MKTSDILSPKINVDKNEKNEHASSQRTVHTSINLI